MHQIDSTLTLILETNQIQELEGEGTQTEHICKAACRLEEPAD